MLSPVKLNKHISNEMRTWRTGRECAKDNLTTSTRAENNIVFVYLPVKRLEESSNPKIDWMQMTEGGRFVALIFSPYCPKWQKWPFDLEKLHCVHAVWLGCVCAKNAKNLMSCSGRDALAAGYIHQLRLHHPAQVPQTRDDLSLL